MGFKTLCSVNTDYEADCVEWCNIAGCEDLLVCGNYHLADSGTKEDTPRVGRIYLFRFCTDTLIGLDSLSIEAGILDLKWLPSNEGSEDCSKLIGSPVLAAVTSIGQVLLLGLDITPTIKLRLLHTVELRNSHSDWLLLSLDFVLDQSLNLGLCSSSAGELATLKQRESDFVCDAMWKAHDFEAWTCHIDHWNHNIVYSGGDDSKFKLWDLREDRQSKFTSSRHNAGVTSIQSNPLLEHIIATGSYDQFVLFWDNRNWKKPLADIKLDGGAWRIKWHPTNDLIMLVACMYEGFRVVRFEHKSATVIDAYMEHSSIAYGADWKRLSEPDCSNVGVSCSFYDKKLDIWNFCIDN